VAGADDVNRERRWAANDERRPLLPQQPRISHPVSKAAYEHGLVLQQRIFTLGPAIFFALGALVHYPRRNAGDSLLAHV
jgi:hypothetical protein